jgi:hypothetical protein
MLDVDRVRERYQLLGHPDELSLGCLGDVLHARIQPFIHRSIVPRQVDAECAANLRRDAGSIQQQFYIEQVVRALAIKWCAEFATVEIGNGKRLDLNVEAESPLRGLR